MRLSTAPTAVLLTVLAASVANPRAAAQYAPTEPPDDVQWQERREPYPGGPLRPGAQLEGSLSGFVWLGVAGFVGGVLLSVLSAVLAGREYSAIPLGGPWAAAFAEEADSFTTENRLLVGLAGALQLAGVGFFIGGLASPDLFVVYDAPVGAPSPFATARLRLTPSAPGALAGASLTLEVH